MRAKNASGAAREEPQEKSLIDKPWRKKERDWRGVQNAYVIERIRENHISQ